MCLSYEASKLSRREALSLSGAAEQSLAADGAVSVLLK
jgi:hypothetical protein